VWSDKSPRLYHITAFQRSPIAAIHKITGMFNEIFCVMILILEKMQEYNQLSILFKVAAVYTRTI